MFKKSNQSFFIIIFLLLILLFSLIYIKKESLILFLGKFLPLEQSRLTQNLVPEAKKYLIDHSESYESLSRRLEVNSDSTIKLNGKDEKQDLTSEISYTPTSNDVEINRLVAPFGISNHKIFNERAYFFQYLSPYYISKEKGYNVTYSLGFGEEEANALKSYISRENISPNNYPLEVRNIINHKYSGEVDYTTFDEEDIKFFEFGETYSNNSIILHREIAKIAQIFDTKKLFENEQINPAVEFEDRSDSYGTTLINLKVLKTEFKVSDLISSNLYQFPEDLSESNRSILTNLEFNFKSEYSFRESDGSIYRIGDKWEILNNDIGLNIDIEVLFRARY